MNNKVHHTEESHLLHHQESSSSRRLEEDVPLYARPRQRQRWDDHQVQPHVNWGDLFWDLFYVSAAFNLAAALKESLTESPGLAVLYFCSCFLPVYNVWLSKVAYDARYAPDDNLFHRILELFHLLALATIVQHIRPVEEMADPTEPTTLLFAVGLVVETLLSIYQQYDIYMNVVGGPEAKLNSLYDMRSRSVSAVFYCLAAMVAFWNLHSTGEDSHDPKHLPILLCLSAYVWEQIFALYGRFFCLPSHITSHREAFVPMNVDFAIHRIGEWTMLMLGESVLALLIVEQSGGRRYYVVFYCGIITVTAFQYLYFRSQPFDPDDHAMRRSSAGGYTFGYSAAVYSGSLIMVGCSYKMILHYFLEQEEGEEKTEAEARYIGTLFSLSTAMSFLSLDLMLMSHRGVIANLARPCQGGKCHVGPAVVMLMDYGLTMLLACLSNVIGPNLELLAICGLLLVILQLLLRTRGMRYFPVSKKAMSQCPGSGVDSRPWPNTTVPQAVSIGPGDN